MATLQKLDLLSMGRLKTQLVDVDGGQVIISELGAADSFSLFNDKTNQTEDGMLKMSTFGPSLVVRCLVDDDGNRLFSDDEAGQLARFRPQIFGRLLTAAMDINGLSGTAQETDIKN
jgi:hypothetical protein